MSTNLIWQIGMTKCYVIEKHWSDIVCLLFLFFVLLNFILVQKQIHTQKSYYKQIFYMF